MTRYTRLCTSYDSPQSLYNTIAIAHYRNTHWQGLDHWWGRKSQNIGRDMNTGGEQNLKILAGIRTLAGNKIPRYWPGPRTLVGNKIPRYWQGLEHWRGTKSHDTGRAPEHWWGTKSKDASRDLNTGGEENPWILAGTRTLVGTKTSRYWQRPEHWWGTKSQDTGRDQNTHGEDIIPGFWQGSK